MYLILNKVAIKRFNCGMSGKGINKKKTGSSDNCPSFLEYGKTSLLYKKSVGFKPELIFISFAVITNSCAPAAV
jgi:hypothetical protein